MLEKYAFVEKHLPLVRKMQCQPLQTETEVFDWIRADRGEHGALDDIAEGCSAWIYVETESENPIGFSGLVRARWRWPEQNSPRVEHLHILNIGIDERFRGQPPGDRTERYSWQILDDLVATSQSLVASNENLSPLLSLYVYHENERAKALYRQYGFSDLPRQVYIDKDSGRRYTGMILAI